MVSVGKIIGLTVSLLLMGILLPIGLTEILAFTSTNATITTLVATVVPIISVIGIVVGMLPKDSNME